MIIRYPTGLYNSVLPHMPGDRGDVTWTISGSLPLSDDAILKLPSSMELRPLAGSLPAGSRATTITQAKDYLGDLSCSTISARRTELGNSAAQYNIGEILEFGSTADIPLAVPVLPTTQTEYRHDLAQFNYQVMGLNTADQEYLENITYARYLELRDQLNQLNQEYLALQVQIGTDQKELNEISKALRALGAVSTTDSSYTSIITRLQGRQTDVTIRIAARVQTTTEQFAIIGTVTDQLQALSVTIK